jgi:hypothetical protein
MSHHRDPAVLAMSTNLVVLLRVCTLRFVLLLVALSSCPLHGEVVLVENGASRATIVIAGEASEQTRAAAQALADTIERISGARLPIVSGRDTVAGTRVFVGRSPAVEELGVRVPSGFTPQLSEEGFVVQTVGSNLVLAGNEDGGYRGTIHAVYDLLEDLGCRWYFPGPYGEVLPQLDRVAIADVERVERPSFRFRNLWYSGWFPVSEQDEEWRRVWCDRNKLNTLPLSLPGDGSITRLAPASKYFESHPQIYALDAEGNRMKDMLCLSEPEAVEIAVQNILETFRSDPDALGFGFAPPDGFPICHCKPCQRRLPRFTGKGYGDPSLSDLWFSFAERVATEIRKEFPERWLLTNGYANRVRPPESVERLSPNLGLQLAVIAACSIHRIGDPKCWQRSLYKRLVERWTKALDCVFVYDYDPGNSLVNLPFPALHNLRHDLPYLKQRGVWGFWTEGTNTWMVTHLNYFVRAKLMWNVEEDVDELVRDYCRRFYGRAAPSIERYVWTLEGAVETATVHETWGRLMPWKVILPPVIDVLDEAMDEAEARAQRAEVRRRVGVLRLVHEHMKAYLAMESAAQQVKFQTAVEWADRMLAMRDEVGAIQSGLLPQTPDWVHTFRTSLEWHRTMYAGLAARAGGEQGELALLLPRRWEFRFDPKDVGVLHEWYRPGHDENWETIDTTLYWEAQGHQDETGWGKWGKAWYRVEFHLPEELDGKPLRLTIGAVYNRGLWIWVNGVMRPYDAKRHHRLGHPDVRAPIDVDVTDLLRPGSLNSVAVLVNTPPPGRNPRGGLHRRSFLWVPRQRGPSSR